MMVISRVVLATSLLLPLGPVAFADYLVSVIEPPEGSIGVSLANRDSVTASGLVGLISRTPDPDAPEDVDNVAALWREGAGTRSLGTLGGYLSEVRDVSERGEVVGRSLRADLLNHAFLWNAAEGMRDLGSLGGRTSTATAVNEVGEVVGWSLTTEAKPRAFYWSGPTGMIGLDPLGAEEAYAIDIDDGGRVTGILESESNRVTRVFAWSAGEGTVDRGPIGGEFTIVNASNDAGALGGHTRFANGDYRAFLFTVEGTTLDLGTFGGNFSSVRAISESGEQAVGFSRVVDGTARAFLWTRSGGMRNLGTLDGSSSASDVNDSGVVVGTSNNASGGDPRAFVWSEADGMVDLNERLSWSSLDALVLEQALAITDDGKIVARARSEASRAVAWLLLTPEGGRSDRDGDGIVGTDDVCPDTVLGIEPTRRTTGNRFYSDEDGEFVDGRGEPSGYTVADTGGCSGQQIVDAAELGKGHLRYGLTRSALEDWIAAL